MTTNVSENVSSSGGSPCSTVFGSQPELIPICEAVETAVEKAGVLWVSGAVKGHAASEYWGEKDCTDLNCPVTLNGPCPVDKDGYCRPHTLSGLAGGNDDKTYDAYDVAAINATCTEKKCNTCSNKDQYKCTAPQVNTDKSCSNNCSFKIEDCCKNPSKIDDVWETIEDNLKFKPFATPLDYVLIGLGVISFLYYIHRRNQGYEGWGPITILFVSGLILGLGLGGIIPPYTPSK